MKTIIYKSLGPLTTQSELQYRMRHDGDFLCREHELELYATIQCRVIDGSLVPGTGAREVDVIIDGRPFELDIVVNPIGMFYLDLEVFDRFPASRGDMTDISVHLNPTHHAKH